MIDLQGQATFPASPELGEYIKQHGSGGADIRVKFGNVSKAGGTIRIASRDGNRFHTVPRAPSAIPIDHELLAGPLGEINPHLRIRIEDSQISGWAAPAAALEAAHALDRLIAQAGPALGLGGFDLSALRIQNAIEAGVFRFGTSSPVAVRLAGWVAMQLDLGLENDVVRLRATGDVNVRGLGRGSLVIARDGAGVTGSAEMAVQLARFSGKVTATYASGAFSIQGTLDYATEKLRGSLTVVVMEASEAEKAARAQIDPQHLAAQGAEATGADGQSTRPGTGGGQPAQHGVGGGQPGRHGAGERGIAGWGELDFAFTDWLTGKAKAIIDPAGDITIIGKIAPPRSIELMAERAYSARLLDASITARYGLPYVADIHAGIGIQLGAIARLGPAVLTDIAVEGTYSTKPAAQTAFAITGALRISAYAGLNLRFEGKAGLTLLDHHVDLGAAVTGTAGVKGYAEARPTLGYREKADRAAGKKGEYVLQGHLELAAQPFLELGGELFVRLDSPSWSPAPDKTWTWPLFSLAYPLPGEFGIAVDVEHAIGSGQPPELHWGKAAFDAGKFTDSLLDRQIPEKRGGGDAQKPAAWKGAAAPASSAAPAAGAARAPGGAKAPGTAAPKAGAPAAKAAKGGQTPDEARNVPKTPDASRRWLEGMKALSELHDRAEKDPETPAEIHQHLAAIKQRFGFARLEPHLQGNYWLIDAELNPKTSGQSTSGPKSGSSIKAAVDEGSGKAGSDASHPASTSANRSGQPARSLRDFADPRRAAHDPSHIAESDLRATAEFAALRSKLQPPQTEADVVMACRLVIRLLRQGQRVNINAEGPDLLRRAHAQLLAARGVEGLVNQVQWAPFNSKTAVSDPAQLKSEFARWLLVAGATAPNATSSRMNCWEVVMFGAHKAHVITEAKLRAIYVRAVQNIKEGKYKDIGQTFEAACRASEPVELRIDSADTPWPLRGDIVVFRSAVDHTCIATGNIVPALTGEPRHEVLSLWDLPNRGRVERTSIERIAIGRRDLRPILFWSARWD